MVADPERSPGFLLWHVTLRWQRAIAAALAPLELTHVQFVLLASTWWLNEQGADPNQLTLARHAGTDVKMTSQVLGKLEGKGLLRREVDASDTRAKRLRVTPAGARLARRALEVVERVDTEFFTPVANQPALLKGLQRLAAVSDR
jgi:DNA-binding MarR family transcriptional regulator